MNLTEKYAPIANQLSIGQYCPPRCFELAGKTIKIKLDSGDITGDVTLEIVDESTIKYDVPGSPRSGEAKYECRKGDDYTYLLSFCIYDPRENLTFVIDKEQELATFMRCTMGENAYYPYLIDTHFGFGYIDNGGEHTDVRRHGFTDDVTGTGIKWVYGHELATVHIYYSSNWYRITYPKDRAKSQSQIEMNEGLNNTLKALPGSDEPAFYVKIKEGMYLVSVTEQNMEKIIGDKSSFRSDTLCFLDNWKRLTSVGRGYGTSTVDGEDSEIFIMIGKYGVPEEADEHFFTDKNPYLV